MRIKSLLTAALLLSGSFILAAQTFTLRSSSVGGQATEQEEFNGFGCDGENVSPQLSWSNPPEGTQSYAITMYDPDAPTGSGFWHWMVFNIPADVRELPAGAGNGSGKMLPQGAVQSTTSYGAPGYGGPCPPKGHGIHEYKITVYALKTDDLGLDAKATPAVLGYTLWQNTLAKASIVMYYSRPE